MTWAGKNCDWKKLVETLQSEIDANSNVIPTARLSDIQHYLDHDEYSMAFEYLYLEIMERPNSHFTLGEAKALEIALFFELNDTDACWVDYRFWAKFQDFLDRRRKSG